jgi:hypothetical protein
MINKALAVIVAILLIAVGIYIALPYFEKWEENVDPDNPELDAVFRQSVTVTYTDGTTEVITDPSFSMYFWREGKTILSFYHNIEVKLNDGADYITFRADEVLSYSYIYRNNQKVLEGRSSLGAIRADNILKGAGWVPVTAPSPNFDAGLWESFYNTAPSGSYDFKLTFAALNLEYYFNGEWYSVPQLGPITFTVQKP